MSSTRLAREFLCLSARYSRLANTGDILCCMYFLVSAGNCTTRLFDHNFWVFRNSFWWGEVIIAEMNKYHSCKSNFPNIRTNLISSLLWRSGYFKLVPVHVHAPINKSKKIIDHSCKKTFFVRYPAFELNNVRIMYFQYFAVLWRMKLNYWCFSSQFSSFEVVMCHESTVF